MNDLENRINNDLSVYNLASATVQLVDLDVLEKRPNGYGSGMLLRSGDRLLVLSVLHNALLRTSVIQGNCVCRPEGFRMECRKDLIWNYFCDDGFRIDRVCRRSVRMGTGPFHPGIDRPCDILCFDVSFRESRRCIPL